MNKESALTLQQTEDRLEDLYDLGFDRSYIEDDAHLDGFSTGPIKVICSQCKALVINGYPTHEHSCPNKKMV